jgi:chromosome segregation ATPase
LQGGADQAKAEIESLRNALRARSDEQAVPQASLDDERLKKARRKLAAARREIEKLGAEETQLKGQIDQLGQQLKRAEAENRNSVSDLGAAQAELREAKRALESRATKPPEEILPPDAFQTNDFDGELAASIAKIAGNTSLHPRTKIQACFRAISAYVQRKLAERNQELAELSQNSRQFAGAANQLIVDLSIALTDEPLTSQVLFKPDAAAKLVKIATEIRQAAELGRHDHESLQAITAHLTQAFQGNEPNAVVLVEELKNLLESQRARLAKKSKSLKAVKKELKCVTQLLSTKDAEIAEKSESDGATIESLSQKLDKVSGDVASLRLENARLKAELENEIAYKTDLESQVEELQRDSLHIRAAAAIARLDSLQKEHAALKAQFDQLTEESKSERGRLTGLAHRQQVDIKEKEAQILELRESYDRKLATCKERYETERGDLTVSFEALITHLREQNANQSIDIQKIAALLTESENAAASLRAENERWQKAVKRFRQELKITKMNAADEKKLAELAAVTNQLALEEQYTRELDALRERTDAEKRRAYAYGAETFRAFFNPLQEIDETSFKEVIGRAKAELERLTTSDRCIRRLSGAVGSQTTQDAVARLLL